MGNGDMGGDTGRLREKIRTVLYRSGAVAVGFAKASLLPEEENARFNEWIGEGRHAGMTFLERHAALRTSVENVLEGAATVVSLAFSYAPEKWLDNGVAAYAYGLDYHEVIRGRLNPLVEDLKALYGHEWRVCIDSAPVAERFWAEKAGIGRRGLNGAVMVEKAGGLCFLAEVLTTLPLEPDDVGAAQTCCGCRKCIGACPTGALAPDGTLDSRLCINYLTIEHRGDWNEDRRKIIEKSGRRVLGCDACLRVCPVNQSAPPGKIEEFHPGDHLSLLDPEVFAKLGKAGFKKYFRHTPFSRAKYEGILRNINSTFFLF